MRGRGDLSPQFGRDPQLDRRCSGYALAETRTPQRSSIRAAGDE